MGSRKNLIKRQKEILIGTLLGDGCLEKNGKNVRLRIDHGLNQKDYLDWKYKEFKNLATNKPRMIKGMLHQETKKFYRRWHFSTFSFFELNDYWYKFYFQKRKRIPYNILELLKSSLSLAVWFMDDGYKRNDCNALRISTDCFNIKEQRLLQECLKKNFKIRTNIHKKGKFWNIYIPSQEAKKFCRIIKPHILPSMEYKIFFDPVTTETLCRDSGYLVNRN